MSSQMKITYFFRNSCGFSIERLFEDISNFMKSRYDVENWYCKYPSKGIIGRLRDMYVACFHQGDVNHITGDVHFLSFFMNRNKTVITMHDFAAMERLGYFRKVLFKLLWLWIPVKRSAFITVVSHSTKQELMKYVRCDPHKIRVIHNCVSEEFKFERKEFNKKCPVILQVGTANNKNLARVSKALEGIVCELIVIGTLRDEQVKKLKQHKICFQNRTNLSREELYNEYRNSDVLIFVSTYEGFGLPIIEAQSVGRPVVTSNILSMPEVSGGAACHVDPFDTNSINYGITRVIHDDGYRESLIAAGLTNVQKFKIQVISKQYEALYLEVVTNNCR